MHLVRFTLLLSLVAVLGAGAQEPKKLSIHGSAEGTTMADQTDVAVTVYNQNRALVRDQRKFTLPTGDVELKFMDVAEQIQPETVSLKSLAADGSIQVLEQNYEYDLMSPDKLMEKYVGKELKIISQESEYNFHEVDAELLSVNNGPIYRIDDEIYLGHPGTVVLPKLPQELIAKPTLVWLLNNRREQQEVEATYLTHGISWKADYVISLSRDETELDVSGWVTLDNQSGATYQDARVKLVAGDVNVVKSQPEPRMAMAPMMMEDALGVPEQEAFGDFHLYTLPRRTTVKQNQTKQVSLLRGEGIQAKKTYEYTGRPDFFRRSIGRLEDQDVGVFLEFQNSAENGLGVPLPAGVMRVYQPDSQGMPQFAGEDRIDHTPKDEEVRLRLGNAFDVVAERTQTSYRRLGDRVHESNFEIELRNHKENPVTVEVVEPIHGDWEITQASHEYEKRDAFTAVFTVEVPADGEETITYTVRVNQ